MNNYLKFVILLTILFTLSACDYISPFQEISKASEFQNNGEYAKAIPHYEAAISGFSKIAMYKIVEYQTRYTYALMLNEHSKNNHPKYLNIAQKNYKLILEYLKNNKGVTITKAMVLSSLANTYQQQAGYTENQDEYYNLLKKAYGMYKEAADGLKLSKDWHNLAYTYYNLGETSEWYGDINEAVDWLKLAIELDNKHGFNKDKKEDQEYLAKLLAKQQIANKAPQPTATTPAN